MTPTPKHHSVCESPGRSQSHLTIDENDAHKPIHSDNEPHLANLPRTRAAQDFVRRTDGTFRGSLASI